MRADDKQRVSTVLRDVLHLCLPIYTEQDRGGEGHSKPQSPNHGHFVRVTEHFTLHQTQRHPLRQNIRKHRFHFLTLKTKCRQFPPSKKKKKKRKEKKKFKYHLRGVTWQEELQLY